MEWHLQFEAFGDQVTVTPQENLDAYEDATFRVSDLSAEEIQAIVDLLHDDAAALWKILTKSIKSWNACTGWNSCGSLPGAEPVDGA